MKIVAKIFASALAVILSAYILPGVHVEDFITAIIVAVVLSLVNFFVKPLLIIITIPVTILTLGLFLLAINAFMILMVDSFVDGFAVDGFWWALIYSLVLSIVSSIFGINDKKED
ncbi:phage holin family protein [Acidiluteibacter ferrifornacis]|uniref:Phage holin family protein n=1 Tax=Acidiluteibacter ferrifornacis TaxID=2692424 RepID=A0A6N9NJ81_9FLAO|nr:phage holin family protein [Acidiluteibacter ferrifornacis]NBG66738.1 phage holin family protein [Acidiluteibacter ferrifornacis]|tara:strand:+ start:34 stop:378 length:345 start_codon:yes stop_codon:yes gene_type:complete